MKLVTRKSCLRGTVKIPGSKSHTIRSVVLAALAEGVSEILQPLVSADTDAVVHCYRQLGAEISCGKTWSVKGTGGKLQEPAETIDVKNSGTTLRIAMGSASLLKKGQSHLRRRPTNPIPSGRAITRQPQRPGGLLSQYRRQPTGAGRDRRTPQRRQHTYRRRDQSVSKFTPFLRTACSRGYGHRGHQAQREALRRNDDGLPG